MKTETLLKSMVSDLWRDLQEPAIFWQLAVLLACLGVAGWRSRLARRRWHERSEAEAAAAAAMTAGGDTLPASVGRSLLSSEAAQQALARLLFPLFALALLLVARPIVGLWTGTTLLRVAIALTMAGAIAQAVVYAVSRLARTPALVAFERTVVVLVWAALALYITGYWADVVELLDSISIPVGKQHITLWSMLASGFWVAVTMLAALWLGGFAESRLLASDALDASLRAVLSRLLRAGLLMVGVLVGLQLVGLDITALSVFGGALGVGIGLGLQRIASNYISGFIVLLERKVRIGDLVKVDSFNGVVRDIRTRFTVIRALDGVEHVVPNEMLTSLPVQNFTATGALRVKVTVQIAYDSDVDRAGMLAVEAALATPGVLPSPPPVVLLREFAADGLTLDVSFSITDPPRAGLVQSDVNRAIWTRFQAHGIDVPFPQRDVRIVGPWPQPDAAGTPQAR